MVTGISCLSCKSIQGKHDAQDIGSQSSADAAFQTAGTLVSQQSVAATQGTSGLSLPMSSIDYSPDTKQLRVNGIGYELRCPNSLKISWRPLLGADSGVHATTAYSLQGNQHS
jgi:hypothetical protein